jgi:drug/metabolite transporter (DMT)-like permease
VCVFWGTTYLGIRIAVEELPPPVMMCARYLLSGGMLLAIAALTGAHLPRGRELWLTALYGVIVIGIGTGSLAYAEQWVPSGPAALLVTTAPFWLVGVEALLPGGAALHWPTVGGMLVGVAGVAVLVSSPRFASEISLSGTQLFWAFLLLQFGSAAWSTGSILQRRLKSRAHPFVSGAIQQLATGIAFGFPAAFSVGHTHWTARGIGATLYLAVFGGAIGYSCYVFAMNRLPVAIASTYTYVNPMVAVLLGSLLYGEPFIPREGAAMVVIFAGVGLVKRAQSRQ